MTPLYVYRCPRCKCTWEVFNPTTAGQQMCIKCKYPANKIPAVSNFHLKGEGWTKKEK